MLNNPQNSNLEKKIEALLFFNADPMRISKLAEYLNVDQLDIREGLESLKISLSERGVNLIIKDDSALLVTSQEVSDIIQKMKREEFVKDLSKAALETLAVVIYRGPIKRSEIDYIRGVNSQFILRLLLIRGLIEKETNPQDERGFLYKPTFDLLSLLGLGKTSEIPQFEIVNEQINNFISQNAKESSDE
jgi:segregation and condensation protein B